MELTFTESVAAIANDLKTAGSYHFTDPFKPYIHPLCTPAGFNLTIAGPHDHLHHKALMYALRTRDLNFWEETATLPGERVGRQRHLEFREITATGDRVGFTQHLSWEAEDGTDDAFSEIRRITCRAVPEALAYEWTWTSELRALRPLELIQSQWSHTMPDHRRVNYHGLGIRLRRDFGGGTRNNVLVLDGERYTGDFADRMGETPRTVEFIGSLDETRPVRRAGVRFKQAGTYDLFVMSDNFAFMTLGPTNRKPLTLERGEAIRESFVVTVFDVAPNPTSQP